MREALDHWDFVIAAYAIGVGGMAAIIAWSWQSMHRAEKRRDEVRNR